MIKYNPKDWFLFIFQLHKADTFRALMWMLVSIAIYTFIICYAEIEYFNISKSSHIKDLPLMHSLLGLVISLLLVFRTNTAYDRWWEGRKLWGALVNNSRNLASKISGILPIDDLENRDFFKQIIPAYAMALRDHLMDAETANSIFDFDEQKHAIEIQDAKSDMHLPNQVAKSMFNKVMDLEKNGTLTSMQCLYINPELSSFNDICGACERIKNTPIPFSYSLFLKKFIFFYIMTLPFGYAISLGYFAIPVVTFIFYVLASLELIAEEIEEPFGEDANDLPITKIAHNIKKHVGQLI